MATGEREQRLIFGEVAETYDRVRPTYPEQLVDDVITYTAASSGDHAIEVGAGTGRATAMFAARGLRLTAIEPSPEMAAVARRNLASFPDAIVHEVLFEHYDGEGDARILFAAQAWHWVPVDVRYPRAHALLADRGTFAAFWNVPMEYRPSALRAALDAVYDRLAPDVPTRGPGSGWTTVAADQEVTMGEIEASGLFQDLQSRTYEHEHTFSTPDYLALLATQSDHRLLPTDQREGLLDAIGVVIDADGGAITVAYTAHLYLARRI